MRDVPRAGLDGRGGCAADCGAIASYIVGRSGIFNRRAHGAAVQLMKQAIANLNGEDLVSIAAYVSSRVPPRSRSKPRTETFTEDQKIKVSPKKKFF